MNRLIPVMLGVVAGGAALAADAATPATGSSTRDCIDTQQINEWHIVDERHAIVRTGPKHYLVTLQSA